MDFETVFLALVELDHTGLLRRVGIDRARAHSLRFCQSAAEDLREQSDGLLEFQHEIEARLAILDQHLIGSPHSPDSDCWEQRAHLLHVLAKANELGEQLTTAMAKISTYLDREHGGRAAN